MKNVVVMTAVEVPGMEERAIPYKYGVASFKKWCEKNNCELFVLDTALHENDVMRINFHRYYAFELLDQSGVEYDQICITDADAIIHPDCHNFFEMTDGKYTVTSCDGSFDWIFRSLENYSKYVFENQTFPFWKYFNAGFQVVNKNHRHLWDELINFYFANQELIVNMQKKFGVGTDQPVINYMVNLSDTKTKYLPYEFCMADLVRKEILDLNFTFLNFKGIYQFNAIPPQIKEKYDIEFWMKTSYEKLYGKL